MDPSALIASMGGTKGQNYMSLKTRTNDEHNKALLAKKIAKQQDEYNLSSMIATLECKRDSRMSDVKKVESTLE